MRIIFEREGGYANLPLKYHADIDELSNETAKKLWGLIISSGILELQQSDLPPSSPPYPDMFIYRLTITEDNIKKSLSFADVTVPTPLHPPSGIFARTGTKTT